MTITFYATGEKRNKLSKTLGTGTQLTGTMREPASLIDPVILIESATVPVWNYAYITEFGRYYFITEIVAEQYKMFRIAMHVDVLMSYKGLKNGASSTGIYGLKPYVTRWEGADVELPETRIPVWSSTEMVTSTVSVSPTWEGSSNLYKGVPGTQGLLKYFLFINAKITNVYPPTPLMSLFFDWNTFDIFTTHLRDTQTLLGGKPITDYIVSLGALPVEPAGLSSILGSTLTFDFPGFTESFTVPNRDPVEQCYYHSATATSLVPISAEWTLQISVPSLTNSARNFAPYHKLSLRFRPFGKFELDPGIIFRNVASTPTTFKVKVEVDPITGNAALYYGKSTANIYLGSANVAIKFPLSASSYSELKVASGALSLVGAVAATIATEGAAAGSIPAAAINAASSLIPNTSVTGGEQFIIDEYPVVESYRKISTDYAFDYLGKPYYAEDYVYNLSGYIEAGRVNIEGTGFSSLLDSERAELDRILKEGVYV